MKELFFVSCTRSRKEETDLYRSLRKLGTDRFLFFENNQRGLSTCYNAVLDEGVGCEGIVVFVHDDVTIGDLFLQEKFTEAFDERGYAIAGLAGSSEFKISPGSEVVTWRRPPEHAWSGAVEHELPDMARMMSAYGPTPRRCVVLDGLFLAVDCRQTRHLRFDEQFAFHFYDIDFCLSAHQSGLVLGTIGAYVTHRSGGSYLSTAFNEAQLKFRAKWGIGRYGTDPANSAQHFQSPLSE